MITSTIYTVDGAPFVVADGEIFGIGGSADFIRSLYSAVKILSGDPAAVSVNILGGYTVARG